MPHKQTEAQEILITKHILSYHRQCNILLSCFKNKTYEKHKSVAVNIKKFCKLINGNTCTI